MLDRLRAPRSHDPERQSGIGRTDAATRRLTACPNCGAHRPGEFRFCRSCGFDYDIAERASSVQPWLTDPAEGVLDRSGGRQAIGAERGADGSAAPVSSEGRFRVGAGRFVLTPRQLIAGAIAVGLGAAAIVSVFGLLLGR